jgi:hypothetical protein
MSSEYRADKEFVLFDLTLITNNGVSADLLHIYSEINIYEDITSNVLTGNIVIQDAINLIGVLPIVGGETLSISWSTAAKDDRSVKKTFLVYKISDKVSTNEKTRYYTIFFISPEIWTNQRSQLVKCYEGTINSIVENIYNETFSEYGKSIVVEETKNLHSIIPCHWEPFKTINYLAKLAISKKQNKTGFVFYEDLNGFHFKSIETIYSQEPSIEYVKNLRADMKIFDSEDYNKRFTNIIKMDIKEHGNLLVASDSGGLGHEWLYLDVFHKKAVLHDYMYLRDFNKQKHVDENPLFPNIKNIDAKSNTRFIKTIYPHSNSGNRTEADWLLMNIRHSLNVHMGAVEMEIEVAGDSDMRVGTIAEINIPSMEDTHSRYKKERFFSGKAMVSSICHNFNRTQYKSIITLNKDSYSDDPNTGDFE